MRIIKENGAEIAELLIELATELAAELATELLSGA